MKYIDNNRLIAFAIIVGCLLFSLEAIGQNCVTQSQMASEDRDGLANTVQALALKVQSNDQDGLKGDTIPEFQGDFGGIGGAVTAAYKNLAVAQPEIEQVYILDASDTKKNADGTAPDTEFICALRAPGLQNAEADFSIRSLPPGRYAFSMVAFVSPNPWMLSMLLRQDGKGGIWKLAGLFAKQTSAAGHDGLWYWSQARQMVAVKQPWTAYIYFLQAQQLLQPADFVSSTHLEKLREEAIRSSPSDVVDGIGPDNPLVVKASDGSEFRFTSIGPDSGLANDKVDIALHRLGDATSSDQIATQKRNQEAMSAFLSLHPDLRSNFHGVWVFADYADRPPVATESAMADIR